MRIDIAIPTYRRPARLATLLASLPPRIAEAPSSVDVRVLVIDNDPEGSGRAAVDAAELPFAVRCVVEPSPGIAAARQRALDETDAELLVFIDDDETPRPEWLSALHATWSRTGAAAVMGSVVAHLPPGTDPWVVASGLFDRSLPRDGTPLSAAATGNLLLDMAQVRRLEVGFDVGLGLHGGEDTLFSRSLRAAGGTIVACPSSVAVDDVAPERLTRSWAIARARHQGAVQAMVDARLVEGRAARLRSRLRNAAKSVAWVGRGAAYSLVGAVTGRLELRAQGRRQIARGAGLLAGAVGAARPEYRRESGDPARRRSPRGLLGAVARRASPLFRSVVAVRTTASDWVLTLDDGPDPDWTPRILDLLRERDAKVTFFVLLTRTRAHPEILARIITEGHEVAFHGVDHRRLTSMPGRDAARMLREGVAELAASIELPVRWYRPPYGALSPSRWWQVRRAGLVSVLWTTSLLDGRDASLPERLAHARRGLHPGAIVLAHDARAGAEDGVDDGAIAPFDRVELLSRLLDEVEARGLRAVTLSTALGRGRPIRAMTLVR